ncbi:TetR family transcriptional regulator [Enterococcus ureilyticus]|uniref:TetR family transcriptional regulator n=1 Tax=Enterococcus ureilyticus TaxID=1131292 RepID=A0A1E5HHC6_9ENTE|nr:TetR/AcrR family transcriptional regulator [Enterococcus ureilyticus]MBM7689688.1 AcrR family transcriptional regulator [Enterococcus ureilyticus]MBO0445734.1 TetR/AcrR family transcriptional regulator [Enterococcus ureilyticus]OEG24040.1 TetR family transcriptional regulator [Enterococcus ureilyticus]
MSKKTDLRVKRTHKMIIEAFFLLVEEKGYDSITIQDIADEAMINRATFYAHFKDKQDLYEQIFDFAVDAFTSVIDTEQIIVSNRIKVKQIEFLLTHIYVNIQKNKNFFLTIMDGSSNELLRKKLADIIYEKYADIFSKLKITENDIEVPIDFIIEYMTSIFIGTLHWWITSDTDMSPNHLARLVIKLVGNGHLTVLGLEIDK